MPLGRPLANTQAFVVDAYGHEQPVGIPGELWLGGAGVATGYLNRPAADGGAVHDVPRRSASIAPGIACGG